MRVKLLGYRPRLLEAHLDALFPHSLASKSAQMVACGGEDDRIEGAA